MTFESTGGCGRGLSSSLRATWQAAQPEPLPFIRSSRFSRRAPRWQPAQSFRRWLSAGVGCAAASTSAIVRVPSGSAISPNAKRSTVTIRARSSSATSRRERTLSRGTPRGRRSEPPSRARRAPARAPRARCPCRTRAGFRDGTSRTRARRSNVPRRDPLPASRGRSRSASIRPARSGPLPTADRARGLAARGHQEAEERAQRAATRANVRNIIARSRTRTVKPTQAATQRREGEEHPSRAPSACRTRPRRRTKRSGPSHAEESGSHERALQPEELPGAEEDPRGPPGTRREAARAEAGPRPQARRRRAPRGPSRARRGRGAGRARP